MRFRTLKLRVGISSQSYRYRPHILADQALAAGATKTVSAAWANPTPGSRCWKRDGVPVDRTKTGVLGCDFCGVSGPTLLGGNWRWSPVIGGPALRSRIKFLLIQPAAGKTFGFTYFAWTQMNE